MTGRQVFFPRFNSWPLWEALWRPARLPRGGDTAQRGIGYALMGGGLASLDANTHGVALTATAAFGLGYG